MLLKKVSIGEKAIKLTNDFRLETIKGANKDNSRKAVDTCYEAPEPEFTTAFESLIPVATTVMEVGKDWSAGLKVTGIDIRETKAGTRSVMIHLHKQLEEKDNEWKFTTPWFRIDKPADGEKDVSMQCTPAQAGKVIEAIQQSERYRDGHRSQMLLFVPDVTENEGAEDEMNLEE